MRICTIIVLWVCLGACSGGKHTEKKQFLLKGNDQLQIGEYRKAKSYFDEALEKDSTFADAYNNRGIANYELGNLREAIND